MQLADAWDTILTRKAEEAPGGEFPLNYTYTAPGFVPAGTQAPPDAPQRVVITAKRPPAPLAPIQIPILTPVSVPLPLAPAAGQYPARRRIDWLPWAAAALGAVVLLTLLSDNEPKRRIRRVQKGRTV